MEEGLILYRGETPGAIGFDIHGGHGQTWTISREHAAVYARGCGGVLKKALLPKETKRLIIVDPVTNDYNWKGIADLQNILNISDYEWEWDIASDLRDGYQIYDLWESGWTRLIQSTGYESIATVGMEGLEEYILNPSVLIILDKAVYSQERDDF